MTIHFKVDHNQLRPLGRPTKGVRSMSLRDGDRIISMDILPSQIVEEVEEANADDDDEVTNADQGPWVLVVSSGGLGKRVPVANFRLQNRAGMGLVAMKFRKDGDELVALRIAGPDDELMIDTNRGIIMRQAVDAISVQSRMATGVQLQRLDDDDAIAAVALVPHLDETENDLPTESDDPAAAAVADVPGAEVLLDIDNTDSEPAQSEDTDAAESPAETAEEE